MVADYQDELDPDDTEAPLPQPNALPPSKDITLSSDEGEGEGEPPAPAVVTLDQDLGSEFEPKEYVSRLAAITPSTSRAKIDC